MIVVTGTFEVASEDQEKFIEAAKPMMAETAREDGCLCYRFYRDVENSTSFRVYEEWQSDDALKAHFHAPHMAVFRGKLADLKSIDRNVKKFEAGEITTL